MKVFIKSIHLMCILLLMAACTNNFEDINTDPNNPKKVPTSALFTNAQKALMDDIRDQWFGGRQSMLYSQYFAQRNYTEEDRYQLRQPTNNNYWTYIYGDVMDLVEIIRLNTDEATKAEMAFYGNNNNQIAAARILKAWAMQVLTDTYGDVPYFDAFKTDSDLTPSYTPQSEIYADLIKELTEASNQIVIGEPVFTSGDILYGSDLETQAENWKKFANSLKMRVALRMKAKDPNYLTYINEAYNSGVFASNADNAVFNYLASFPNSAPLYDAFFIENRNDFSLSKTFVDLLKGENDQPNDKTNPFAGSMDPRLEIWARPINGQFNGMPYGIDNDNTATPRPTANNFNSGRTIVVAPNAGLVYMDYAEVCFILSEANGWAQDWYEKGVTASLDFWASEAARTGTYVPADYSAKVTTYLSKLPAANEETVLTQKYIALFMQGEQAWAEYRRTGYPNTLVKPGEINYVTGDGTELIFEPLVGDEIPQRINYPQLEQNLNASNYAAAVQRIGGSDDLSTPMWWAKQD